MPTEGQPVCNTEIMWDNLTHKIQNCPLCLGSKVLPLEVGWYQGDNVCAQEYLREVFKRDGYWVCSAVGQDLKCTVPPLGMCREEMTTTKPLPFQRHDPENGVSANSKIPADGCSWSIAAD